MPRVTRAAMRAGANQVADQQTEHASEAAPASPVNERVPLGEMSPNKAIEQEEAHAAPAPKKTKGKGGRKAAKGKKGKKAEREVVEEERVEVVLEDEREAAASPASDTAVDDLANNGSKGFAQVPIKEDRPATPPSRAVRMTRRQLAKVEQQPSQLEPLGSAGPERSAEESYSDDFAPQKPLENEAEESEAPQVQAEASGDREAPEISPETNEDLRNPPAQIEEAEETEGQPYPPEQPGLEAAKACENSHELSGDVAPEVSPAEEFETVSVEPKTLSPQKAVSESGTGAPARAPSRSPARSPMRLEESIEAIDALEEALEQVGKAIPLLETDADEKSPRKREFDASGTPTHAKLGKITTTKPQAPPLRMSRVPGAIKSLKPVPNPGRVQGAPKTSVRRSASTRISSTKELEGKTAEKDDGPAKPIDYLVSKRRPISMSFPTPPAPPKSSRPPTKPAFQLPGEAVAVKLKAQKEERLKRMEEEAAKKSALNTRPEEEALKKPAFKARPVPKAKAPAPVKQTAASKARLNLLNGVKTEGEDKPRAPSAASATRSSSMSSTIIEKRQSTITAPPRPIASKRLSTVVNPLPVPRAGISASEVATQRLKAREIFNRDKLEKERLGKERREKEEAAKRARAEAAERGRIASREWAEKQKMKKIGKSTAAPATADSP